MKRKMSRQGMIAGLGALSAALVVLWLPVGLLEMVVASSGLSEQWPAAAPPLGWKARLMLALFVAIMTGALLLMPARVQPAVTKENEGKGRGKRAEGANIMGFAFSKLTALARGRGAISGADEIPVLRKADAHPDAPARAPIFASRDFGGADIFGGIEREAVRAKAGPAFAPPGASGAAGVPSPTANAPLPLSMEDMLDRDFLRAAAPISPARAAESIDGAASAPLSVPASMDDPFIAAEPTVPTPIAPVAVEPPMVAPAPFAPPSPPAAAHPEPASLVSSPPASKPALASVPIPAPSRTMSITELTERLERGFALRGRVPAPAPAPSQARVIADMPVASAVPVRSDVAGDSDDALRAALGALRTMTQRTR